MSFFRKWKLYTKHKKLSEEWALATSLKDFSDSQDQEDEENVVTYNLKYLGSTNIESERSENATAEAIKSVLSTAKSARKKSQRCSVNVSPRGIEVLEPTSGDTFLKVSIYNISYCSADAVHDHMFAFIGSTDEEAATKSDEQLACHVFQCPKRKIAHDVTLSVARCFETAYQIWRISTERRKYQDEMKNKSNVEKTKQHHHEPINVDVDKNSVRDLLIDFTPEIRTDLYQKDHRDYLQNTWVSFEDDNRELDNRLIPQNAWGQQLVC